MLPDATIFAEAMQHMGIRKEDSVVVYDSKELGIFSAPRVGWTLKVFGHENVHVLNNFKKWVEEGYPTESGEGREPYPSQYPVPEIDLSKVVAFEEVKELAKELKKEGAEEVQILDARSKGRWEGVDPEPREGMLTKSAITQRGAVLTNPPQASPLGTSHTPSRCLLLNFLTPKTRPSFQHPSFKLFSRRKESIPPSQS
jgi:3-mercaptopyruvate sulfurtransferase SseA